MKKSILNQNLGFTLVELLVVISIIGVLAGLVLVSFSGSQKQARDTQRKSDLKQYQTSLESLANATGGLYPSYPDPQGAAMSGLCISLSLSGCVTDPREAQDPTYSYRYQSDGSGAGVSNATSYVLWALLENTPDYWVICSNGQVGLIPAATWSNPVDGACPL